MAKHKIPKRQGNAVIYGTPLRCKKVTKHWEFRCKHPLSLGHIQTFANSISQRNFYLGRVMKGRRLEAFIESFKVLEFLNQLSRGKQPGKAEFTFRRNDTIKDFEVATALRKELE
ncbi:MAG: hypothetical protein P8N49_01085 [Opitutales bacterium]|nr:hypothetical protein [Opitutales bacterium]